ncbi:MAG: type II/IV secretion system protein [Patescibacteria group bacterium]|nr:type II/IV secretion system protein [Patescibacteria group bacterium]
MDEKKPFMSESAIGIEPATAVDAVDGILERAARLNASDVHIDPRADDILVRFRIDGEVEQAGVLPRRLHEEMIARLKIMSGARTDIHAVPQDGRFMAELCGRPYNVRISFMPTYRGENFVARLLPAQAAESLSFAALGFTPDHAAKMSSAALATNGLILVTGPTGSGKTTTLRVFLGLKSSMPLSVMTLEDPVEYEVPGVRQVHISQSHGVSFASGLRAAVRQDPDVIMVGEIRDEETARTAVHTALTGHLVLSTLHTVSALEAILRLSDMGVERYLMAATLRLIVGQRLVRRICDKCAGDAGRADRCEVCRGTGYSGRSVIAEVCEVDHMMRGLIAGGASQSVLREHALSNGFRTMSEDAGEKVDWGVTTAEEAVKALYS